MGKRIMVDVLILGTAITGIVTAASLVTGPIHGFMVALAIVNLSSAVFFASVVRPIMHGRAVTAKGAAHASLLVLLASSGALFFVEYFFMAPRTGALTAAVTWSLGALLYAVDLVIPAKAQAPAKATAQATPAAAAH
jgi:hypothetical protein